VNYSCVIVYKHICEGGIAEKGKRPEIDCRGHQMSANRSLGTIKDFGFYENYYFHKNK
jgi:hypothetical protein